MLSVQTKISSVGIPHGVHCGEVEGSYSLTDWKTGDGLEWETGQDHRFLLGFTTRERGKNRAVALGGKSDQLPSSFGFVHYANDDLVIELALDEVSFAELRNVALMQVGRGARDILHVSGWNPINEDDLVGLSRSISEFQSGSVQLLDNISLRLELAAK